MGKDEDKTRLSVAYPRTRLRRDGFVACMSAILTLLLTVHLRRTEPTLPGSRWTDFPNSTAVIQRYEIPGRRFFATYDPLLNGARLASRVRTQCNTVMPTSVDLERRNLAGAPEAQWTLSRYIAYYNIAKYMRQHKWRSGRSQLKVLTTHEGRALLSGLEKLVVTYISLDELRRANDNTFDVVIADGMLQHSFVPHFILLDMHRVLRDGGLGIVVSEAYNPVRGAAGVWADYWRIAPDGLLALSMPFPIVRNCGSWGNAKVIEIRAKRGRDSFMERAEHWGDFENLLRRNEIENPFVVWMVLEK